MIADLRANLEQALGPLCRIEREVRSVGRYRLFVVHDLAAGADLVVKVLPRELSLSVDPQRFEREILLLADREGHPNLVAPRSAGAAGGCVFHTRPFIGGTTLRALLTRHGELPLHQAVQILKDVLKALAHVHGQGIVHGDLRPENVLLVGGHAAVADAGVMGAVAAALHRSQPAALADGLADPVYLAPERLAGNPLADHRADVFAIGTLTYEMLAGKPPGGSLEPLELRRAVPHDLVRLVFRCLASRPEERWQRAEEVLAGLGRLGTH